MDTFADPAVAVVRESRELHRLLNAMGATTGVGEYQGIRTATQASIDRLDAARRHLAGSESAALEHQARYLVAEPRHDEEMPHCSAAGGILTAMSVAAGGPSSIQIDAVAVAPLACRTAVTGVMRCDSRA